MTRAQHISAHRYGPYESQFGFLSLPDAAPPYRVVVLLHGGFWQLPWALDLMDGAASDLTSRGLAVWNLEYRRLGEPGAGWPGTFGDVVAGLDALADLPAATELNLNSVAVAGHSAGGHLALWLAGERGPSAESRVVLAGAVGLAAVADLRAAWERGAGSEAVEALLGGLPHAIPERYRAASPADRLPCGLRTLLVHGERDRVVPPELSRLYVAEARRRGDDASLAVFPRTGHMDVINPRSEPWKFAARWLEVITDEAI
ncbi:alpha/beta hydrolase [soil metagenome]